MSIKNVSTILQTGYNPNWYVKPWRRLNRRIEQRLDSMERQTIRYAIRQKAALVRWRKSQYYLTTAARDVYRAFRLNEDIVAGLLIACAFVGYVAVSSAANVLYFLSEAIMNVTGMAGLAIIPILLLMMSGLGLLVVWSVAAMTAAAMHAVVQSLNRKIYRSLRETLVFGYRNGLRMITTWLLVLAIAFSPVALVCMLYGAAYLFRPIELATITSTIPYAVIAVLTWLMYCTMHYSLLPVIVVLEPTLSVKQMIARSHELPLKRGRMFLLGLHFALVGVLALLYGAAWLLNLIVPIGILDTTLLLGFGVLLGYYSILTAFYRRRRLSRA